MEYSLHEKLCKLTQTGSLHDYIGALSISPLELRFYFQQGLRMEIGKQLREHHLPNLDETIQLALRFDHGLYKQQQSSDWEKTATCHRCKVVGHIAPNCPTLKP
ncbi:Hypothetical protein PHPALM_15292 [Phytophthora palmivora]|uniref:CCHC-type domain-containing protein n=1 Tax=Phytophthora palmivora TaxID=4796 RepID=A0A2P4XSP5_9STRA|nr:Hypothetical protein PHPALM_15292 [Phytophthora palmivora]